MMEWTTRDEARRRPGSTLNMPPQAPPVHRTEPAAAHASDAAPGVEAARFIDIDVEIPGLGKGGIHI
jgi:hypothetical protein